MKTCPICQSVAFDDAVTCYGCLHEFAEGEGFDAGLAGHAEPAPASACAIADGGRLPSFVIQIKPERERSGQMSWTCAVDVVSH